MEANTNQPGQNQTEKKLIPVDGTFSLEISPDHSEAFLVVRAAQNGGREVTLDEVRREMGNRNIKHGLDEEMLSQIFSMKMYDSRRRIACWDPPVNGQDGTVEYHVDMETVIKPKEDEKGFVDYKDLGIIRNTKKGTAIATIVLPTEGQPGVDIHGHTVRQKPGKPAAVSFGENLALSGDGTQLIVTEDGNLKCTNGRFSVETVFNIKEDVDASTGNLDFIGSIIIRGEVMEGFHVTSAKNITIYGNCTGAVVEAGGDVVIKQGCLNSQITAHGNVSVQFVESSKIHCDGTLKGDIFTSTEAYCGGELICSGAKGYLRGGKYTCLQNLTANCIGTESYVSTLITVGDNAVMMEEKEECQKQLKEMELLITRYTQAIDFLTKKKRAEGRLTQERDEMLTASIRSRIAKNQEKTALKKRMIEIDKYLETREQLEVICRKKLYPGVKINVNDTVFHVKEVYQHCKIYMGDDGIVIQNL